MANRAYVSVWTRNHSEALMLDRFERLLVTVPLSAEHSGFASLVIRAVNPAEAPLLALHFLIPLDHDGGQFPARSRLAMKCSGSAWTR